VEGDLTLVECVGSPQVCSRVDSCVTRDVWALAGERVLELLNSITLKDLIHQQGEKQGIKGPMWHI
jgi:DNA-binding IscR family transcriptional regulator